MQPTWLIEVDRSGLPSEALQTEIRRQGMDVYAVKFFPQTKPPGDIAGCEQIPRDAHVLFMGGPALMWHIQQHRRWRPGGWCTFENFSCPTYYTYLGAHLLNRSYTMLPAAEAVRQIEALFKNYSQDGQVFVRPAVARKLFNGTLADRDRFRQLFKSADLDPRTLVVVAEPRSIGREWRLFVANSDVIAASQYCNRGELEVSPGCPSAVTAFAERLLSCVKWRPDPLFTMDVCEANDSLYLLELNGFSCSSPYQCDLETIVRTAANAASLLW